MKISRLFALAITTGALAVAKPPADTQLDALAIALLRDAASLADKR